ncbi:hypothetical protein HYC85_029119 [Camellia sinensis]|uniref:Uncharacterized protein n=1 Tax=Camellia sinensis TaxID=4442 RepID=A0A7J7FZF5_CAMSI|nr:hypothetical protein HYC85_029119 [Camellia sinensis]
MNVKIMGWMSLEKSSQSLVCTWTMVIVLGSEKSRCALFVSNLKKKKKKKTKTKTSDMFFGRMNSI